MTKGNLEKRYIGVTDESLCQQGKEMIQNRRYPTVDAVYASPLKRCIETAKLIYPEQTPIQYDGFRECDFGEFENKNFSELELLPSYQCWMKSNGELPFPSGESKQGFKERCVVTFRSMIEECIQKQYKRVALVVHGGTIMSILDEYSNPHKDFYHWQVANGEGYQLSYENQKWKVTNI